MTKPKDTGEETARKPKLKPKSIADRNDPLLDAMREAGVNILLFDAFEDEDGNVVPRITHDQTNASIFCDPLDQKLIALGEWIDAEMEHGSRVDRESTFDAAKVAFNRDLRPAFVTIPDEREWDPFLSDIAKAGFAIFALDRVDDDGEDKIVHVSHPNGRTDVELCAILPVPEKVNSDENISDRFVIIRDPKMVEKLLAFEEEALRGPDMFGEEWPDGWTK